MRRIFWILTGLLITTHASAQVIVNYAGGGIAGLGDGGPATAASIGYISGIAVDEFENLYIADGNNNRIRKVDAITKNIFTIAGDGSFGYNGDHISASVAKLNNPNWVAVDKHGNIYVTDAGNRRIRKIDVTTGLISTIAGNGVSGFGGDNGPATDAAIIPQDIALDQQDNLYISDGGNQRIRKVSVSGIITTVAGNGTVGFSGDNGPATAAALGGCYGIAIDTFGNIFVSDWNNHRIRKISVDGIINSIGGIGNNGYDGDNKLAIMSGIDPFDIAVDFIGNKYVADFHNNRIRKISSNGIIQTVAGNGGNGYSGDGGPALSAMLNGPEGVVLANSNNLYIADFGNKRIRKIVLPNMSVDVKKTRLIVFYPNPANDELHIDEAGSSSSYRLLSIVGTVMQQGELKEGNNTISIQSLPAGVYMVEVTVRGPHGDKEGERVVRKVIKQ